VDNGIKQPRNKRQRRLAHPARKTGQGERAAVAAAFSINDQAG